MTTTVYAAAGLAREKCLPAMLEKVRAHLGVGKVAMDLVAGGRSPLVRSGTEQLGAVEVGGVFEGAAFGLLPPRGPVVPQTGDGPSRYRGDTGAALQQLKSSIGGVRS